MAAVAVLRNETLQAFLQVGEKLSKMRRRCVKGANFRGANMRI